MKTRLSLFSILYLCTRVIADTVSPAEEHPFSTEYLQELLDDIYYWNVDASSYFTHDTDTFIEVEIAPAIPAEGAGYTGEWWNIIIPDLELHIDVAKRNYTHADLGITVTNETYKIISLVPVSYETEQNHERYVKVYLDEETVYQNLARRFHAHPRPATQLVQRLTHALRQVITMEGAQNSQDIQRFHVAPPSHFWNTIWVYWENKDALIRFSSATSWRSPGFWTHIPLFTKIYDLRTDVIVSPHEHPGSNAYITRQWAGRILCNCLVHGGVIHIPSTSHSSEEMLSPE